MSIMSSVPFLYVFTLILIKEIQSGDCNDNQNIEFKLVSTSTTPSTADNTNFDVRFNQLTQELSNLKSVIINEKFDRTISSSSSSCPSDIQNLDIRLKTLEEETKNTKTSLNKLEQKVSNIENLMNEKFNTLFKKFDENTHSLDNNKTYPKHCKEVKERGRNTSGIYTVQPATSPTPFLVFCDMVNKGGGWTYFLNRFDGRQDFYLGWEDYKNGFGNLSGEFWLGLEYLHHLTGNKHQELLIEMESFDFKKAFARYNSFSVGNEKEGYVLKLLGKYSGDAGDSLSWHQGMKFTTKDKDQDSYGSGNCATDRGGGWWYNACATAHLTGKYRESSNLPNCALICWYKFLGSDKGAREARMMIRPMATNV